MSNKKRIRKLIRKKYVFSRNVKYFNFYQMGWDFATQFEYVATQAEEASRRLLNWYREVYNYPSEHVGVPELKDHVKWLERQLRGMRIYDPEFHEKAQELRKAREDLKKEIGRRTEAFEKSNNFYILSELPIRVSEITKHLF